MEANTPAKNARRGYVLRPGEGAPGFDASVKASAASTGGAITLIESRTDGGAPRHVHTREDEYFYVISGRIIVHCGEDTFEGGPGSFVFLPREVPHDWDVLGGGEAVLLMITVPAMLETFLAEFHTASDREEVAKKYGVTFL